ncbi:MAG: hypothetical protein JWO19_1046 [Bryobacterales bacterium]|nr:hypothetical protein [Bryobacterales bacterium]
MSTGKKIVYTFLAAMVPMLLFAYATGPDARYTAAPGDNPLACSAVGCHTGSAKGGPINAAGGGVTATFSSGSTYTPGQPVTITVNVTDPVNTFHGFQMSARLESNLSTSQAGKFSYTQPPQPQPGFLVMCDNNLPRPQPNATSNCPANFPVEFIEHNAPRTGTWTFIWTPPSTNQGPVHFYVAGNAVNGDGNAGFQDHVYTASYVLQPPAACIQSVPVITTVRSAAGFGGYNFFTSGSYLEIVGSSLAGITETWQGSDFNGNNAPTVVQGTSVSINGKPGFVSYISPTQVNVQAPADTATGPVGITVTNCSGTSAPATLTRASVAAGMLAPAADLNPYFNVGGKQYLVATFGPQALYVGATTMIPGGLSQPAKPGDSIWLYGIGFGDVTGSAPGVIAPGGTTLNAPVTISFGQTPATITYKGLYPSFVGLDLFIVTVPNVADGDYPINVTVNGQPVQQPAAFLTVHK